MKTEAVRQCRAETFGRGYGEFSGGGCAAVTSRIMGSESGDRPFAHGGCGACRSQRSIACRVKPTFRGQDGGFGHLPVGQEYWELWSVDWRLQCQTCFIDESR